MSQLELVSKDIAILRDSIKSATKFIAQLKTAEETKQVFDEIKLLKEWSKIRTISEEMQLELLRLEVHCLRKIGKSQLAKEILPANQTYLASFYADKTDSQIEEMLSAHGKDVGPVGLRRNYLHRIEFNKGRNAALFGDRHLIDSNPTEDLGIWEFQMRVKKHSEDISAAFTSILSNYETRGESFSVEDLTDFVIDEMGYTDLDSGIRRGLSEVCREAIRHSPDRYIRGNRIPAFITCSRINSEGYTESIRVPSDAASLMQFLEMVELRELQAKELAIVAQNLRSLYEDLKANSITGESPSTPLKTLLERLENVQNNLVDAK